MAKQLKLMCVLAHPDDESLGTGGILARYAAEGVATSLVTATRGERGWPGSEAAYPGPDTLARLREEELHAAAKVLGIEDVSLLGYEDGRLDEAEAGEVIGNIASHMRRVRPDVVVTFDPNGSYGHPDHIAICQFTMAAVVAAADQNYEAASDRQPHRVSKLYYMAETEELLAAYEEVFGQLVMTVDGQERRSAGWEPWAVTTRIDTAGYSEQVWQAIACHRSQLGGHEALMNLPEAQRTSLFATQTYYRAYSLVNGGRDVETDLFAGLRESRS